MTMSPAMSPAALAALVCVTTTAVVVLGRVATVAIRRHKSASTPSPNHRLALKPPPSPSVSVITVSPPTTPRPEPREDVSSPLYVLGQTVPASVADGGHVDAENQAARTDVPVNEPGACGRVVSCGPAVKDDSVTNIAMTEPVTGTTPRRRSSKQGKKSKRAAKRAPRPAPHVSRRRREAHDAGRQQRQGPHRGARAHALHDRRMVPGRDVRAQEQGVPLGSYTLKRQSVPRGLVWAAGRSGLFDRDRDHAALCSCRASHILCSTLRRGEICGVHASTGCAADARRPSRGRTLVCAWLPVGAGVALGRKEATSDMARLARFKRIRNTAGQLCERIAKMMVCTVLH